MRNRKTIRIDEREVTVTELRVKDIRRIVAGGEDADWLRDYLPMLCDMEVEAFDELAPSEIEQIVEAAREVNAPFLAVLEKTGAWQAIRDSIRKELIASWPGSSKPAT